MKRTLFIALFTLASLGMAHEGGRDNCRVTLQTYFSDGKRTVDVTEVHVDSHSQCKTEAQRRRIASEKIENEEIIKVNVIFAYRDLAIER